MNPSVKDPLNNWMTDPVKVALVQQMKEDFDWAMEHHQDLERQYLGESVVVWHKQVIAHGTDEEEILRQASNPHRPREQLVVIEFPAFFESPR
jgi:hypothetical protein